jgi:hypothetical protein
MINTRKLAFVTAVLFVVSLAVYYQENHRSAGLMAGSDLVRGLNVEKISRIVLSYPDEQNLIFNRDQGRFIIESHKSYPASTIKINDLIYKIASFKIKEKVTENASERQLKSFGLAETKQKYKIELFDQAGQLLQSLRVGERGPHGGYYVQKSGEATVYLTESDIWLDSRYKDFVDRVILALNKEQFKDTSKAKNLSLRFDEVFTPADQEVKAVSFDQKVTFESKEGITYSFQLGADGDRHFIKTEAATSAPVPQQVVVGPDTNQQDLEKLGDSLKANEEAGQYNRRHSSWVYQISESDYKTLLGESL